LFGIEKATVDEVVFDADEEAIIAAVRPRKGERSRCGVCRRRCPGYDAGEGVRRWRALDLGTVRAFLEPEAAPGPVPGPPGGGGVGAVGAARRGAYPVLR
jgi:hypothetical protein